MKKAIMKGRNLLCKVDVKDIAFLNAIFEWYHEVATVRTKDRKEGLIELWIAPTFYEDALKAIDYLKSGGFVKKFEIVKEVGDDWHKE
ncbi:hypothetical protein Dester_1308 [Desulfurobacterium thermolithotrophum DSM 11699]|uniref:DUF4911 domain-containing protein n=1 Tax=Desulfurobacterium thermolithotrophum (strain DSM 11699 / BSA) TaxID=868864 RepID=F0S165_DESTD|nr:DUF4911 domain-containing protein [Desulfurobacterium thermolithotrophum]ADY73943.1 hypothetical protein Dester_1308 [Desulfurobacterium thermolithotrophum DSM 11699]